MTALRGRLVFAALGILAGIGSSAQVRPGALIRVTESSGIRRTEYPVRARVQTPQRAVPDAAHAKLRLDDATGAEVPAQYAVAGTWPDGSAQTLEVDFNVSLAPGEARTYRLEYGADVSAELKPRGLAVSEEAGVIQVGNVKFSRTGAPLLASANYVRSEFIGQFAQARNGIAIVDKAGARHDISAAQPLKVDILKRGPLLAALQYSGSLALDAATAVPFTITIEMPNSKSWIKTSAEVRDPGRRVRDIEIDTPFTFGAFPWVWDFGTENGTYGAFRSATDSVLLTQTVEARPQGTSSSWRVETPVQGELRPLEASMPPATPGGRRSGWSGWGHLQGPMTAAAFGIDGLSVPGTYAVALNGQGQATFRFSPSATATTHRFGIYEHLVSTPVPIGAATSATSMLNPPVVTVMTR